MKGKAGARREHFVCLSPQAQEGLRVAKAWGDVDGDRTLVFGSPQTGQAFCQAALNRLTVDTLRGTPFEGRQTVHGWRSVFSTTMNKASPRDRAIIDLM